MFERSSRLVTFLVDLYPLRVFPFLSLMRSRAELALFLTSFCSVLFHFPKVSSSAGGRTWSLSTWKRRSHPFSPGIFSSEKLVPFRRLSLESRVSKNKKIKKQSREYILNKYVNKYSIEKEGKRKRVRPCLSASAVEERRETGNERREWIKINSFPCDSVDRMIYGGRFNQWRVNSCACLCSIDGSSKGERHSAPLPLSSSVSLGAECVDIASSFLSSSALFGWNSARFPIRPPRIHSESPDAITLAKNPFRPTHVCAWITAPVSNVTAFMVTSSSLSLSFLYDLFLFSLFACRPRISRRRLSSYFSFLSVNGFP